MTKTLPDHLYQCLHASHGTKIDTNYSGFDSSKTSTSTIEQKVLSESFEQLFISSNDFSTEGVEVYNPEKEFENDTVNTDDSSVHAQNPTGSSLPMPTHLSWNQD
jgi:hypothetical protein